jgi:hypothetical protein
MHSFNAPRIFRQFFFAAALCAGLLQPLAAEEKLAISLPPSADIHYGLKAQIKGVPLSGTALIQWQGNRHKYRLLYETRTALTGSLMLEISEGTLDAYGIAPEIFSTKRFRRDQAVVNFDRQTRQVNFPGNAPNYVLQGGEQDRISVLWQLLAMGRASPERLRPGAVLEFNVVGQHDSESWVFEVKDTKRLRTAVGELDVLHVTRTAPKNAKTPQMDVWFAPSLEWLPVRLRLSEENGDYIEQNIEKLTRK